MHDLSNFDMIKKVRQELLHLIATSLVFRSEYREGWHYHLMAVDGSNGDLAACLGLSNKNLKNIMIFCGLVRLNGEQLCIKRNQ